MKAARWASWDGEGRDAAAVDADGGRVRITGAVRAGPDDEPWATYCFVADAAWCTREADVRLADGRALALRCDGDGHWTRDGVAHPRLDGATDVDLSATPATNTLPIRRLGLPVGAAADVVTAYIDLPGLGLRADRQRYTRLASGAYRFEQHATGFVRDIEVDGDGLVTSYPGLFRRLA